jgi:hypothetical protein
LKHTLILHPDDDATDNLQNILAQIGRHQYSMIAE